MTRPPAPKDPRSFRDRTRDEIRHGAKPPAANKAAAGDGIDRRIEMLTASLETTANKTQRARIRESIAAAKRAKKQWTEDMAPVIEREARATDPKYLEAVKLAESTLEAIKINESLHQGFLDGPFGAATNLKELRHSLDYEVFAVRQQALKDMYDADRAEKRGALETHRQAIGDDIALLSSEPAPTDPSAPRPAPPGSPRNLYEV